MEGKCSPSYFCVRVIIQIVESLTRVNDFAIMKPSNQRFVGYVRFAIACYSS